ncbi:hypothetical protein [Mucilaginibacter lacusdianchii]|uniref:hypothetical protein n=1 Tax=Mucilaginibacter lacusdianchii TaxID=2684211 RepID=UPI00131DC5E7|nr:hypothetical protein [Mucilaginibacter sp. JXJ CY 39]
MDNFNFDDFDHLSSQEWGKYYLSRYYFSIQTKWTRKQAGLSSKQFEISAEIQNEIQQENLPTIFHEFFHYLHDVSTILSSALFQNRILMLSIFTSYLDPTPGSGASLGTDKNKPDLMMSFVRSWKSNEVMTGSGPLEFPMKKIDRIAPEIQELHFPIAPEGKQDGTINVPAITYSGVLNGKPVTGSICLGRFYLFEFLAYEMDQILDMRKRGLKEIEDPLKGTEYTVCRMVAQMIFPLVRQEIAMAAGLLALQNIDSGHAFISTLQRIGNAFYQGIDQDITLNEIAEETKQVLIRQRAPFFSQQDAYVEAFKGRTQLEVAYKYLAEVSKGLYDKRIEDIFFELTWLLNKEYDKILETAPLCDYLYKFLPNEGAVDLEFNRDFMATNLPEETSVALKTLIAYDHFFFSHRGGIATARVEASPSENHCCPFYTCCDLKDRADNAAICKSKPWRIYDVQYNRDKRYCWYATGVLEAKGTSKRRS